MKLLKMNFWFPCVTKLRHRDHKHKNISKQKTFQMLIQRGVAVIRITQGPVGQFSFHRRKRDYGRNRKLFPNGTENMLSIQTVTHLFSPVAKKLCFINLGGIFFDINEVCEKSDDERRDERFIKFMSHEWGDRQEVVGPTCERMHKTRFFISAVDIINLRKAQRHIRRFLTKRRTERLSKLAIMDQVFEIFQIPLELAEIILKEANLTV